MEIPFRRLKCREFTFACQLERRAGPSGRSPTPNLLQAAKQSGVAAHQPAVAYAWGDMMTDMVQPFLKIER